MKRTRKNLCPTKRTYELLPRFYRLSQKSGRPVIEVTKQKNADGSPYDLANRIFVIPPPPEPALDEPRRIEQKIDPGLPIRITIDSAVRAKVINQVETITQTKGKYDVDWFAWDIRI